MTDAESRINRIVREWYIQYTEDHPGDEHETLAGEAAASVLGTLSKSGGFDIDEDRLRATLFTAVKARRIDEQRRSEVRQRHVKPTSAPDQLAAAPANGLDPETRERLLSKIDELPDRERTAVELYFLEAGGTQAEIAARMGITQQSFSNLLARAVKELSRLLSDGDARGAAGD